MSSVRAKNIFAGRFRTEEARSAKNKRRKILSRTDRAICCILYGFWFIFLFIFTLFSIQPFVFGVCHLLYLFMLIMIHWSHINLLCLISLNSFTGNQQQFFSLLVDHFLKKCLKLMKKSWEATGQFFT